MTAESKNYFCVLCHDGADGLRLRKEAMDAHLSYIETVQDHIRVAGPIPAGPDGAISGSLLIYEAADEAACRTMLENDPYHQAGVWDRIEIYPLRAVAGTWLGGLSW